MLKRRVTVLGDGAMATVCAMLLVEQGQQVTLWGPFADHIQQLRTSGRNDKYLSGIELPKELGLTSDDATAAKTDLLVCAIPTQYVRNVCKRLADHLPQHVPIVSVTKGVENDTLLRPTQVLNESLGRGPNAGPIAALSGPSIARELAERLPATLCAASEDLGFAEEIQHLFTTSWMRVYTNPDVVGVELAGATKNVIALAAGMIDGLNAGFNAKSALLARGLSEITRLGTEMGADAATFFGVTGVGDLATTCFCPEGRNRSCGELLGKGLSLQQALEKFNGVVEGVATTKSVVRLAERHNVDMPITAAIHDVLFEGLSPMDAIARLMARPLKRETVG